MRWGALILAVWLGFLAGGGRAHADQVALLGDGPEALEARIDLIRGARSEILVSTYIFQADSAGTRILRELEAAAARGVSVRVLFDSYTLRLPPELSARLQRSGIRIYRYHPVSILHPRRSNRRLHDKLFVVDRSRLIIGDRNLAENYFDNRVRVSKDLYVEGGSAPEDAASYFDSLVSSREVEAMRDSSGKLGESLASVPGARVEADPASGWRTRLREAGQVRFFHDPVGAKGELPGTEEPLLKAIEGARSRIAIENPYIVLTERFRKALADAAARGVAIEVVTNSADASDGNLVAAAWERSRAFFASIGADVWEHPGRPGRRVKVARKAKYREPMLHAKSLIIDGRESFLKSFNLDPRSESLNMEVAAQVSDPAFAAELQARIDQEKLTHGYIRTLDSGAPAARTRKCGFLFGLLSRAVESHL